MTTPPKNLKMTSKNSRGGRGRDRRSQREVNRVIKLPQQFCVEVPILNEQGRIDRDSDGNVKTLREVGMYTCYHEAHKNCWKRFFLQKNKEEILEMQKDPRVPRRNKKRRRESI